MHLAPSLINVQLGEAPFGRIVPPAAELGPGRDKVPLGPVRGEAAEVPPELVQKPEVSGHRCDAVLAPHRPLPALDWSCD